MTRSSTASRPAFTLVELLVVVAVVVILAGLLFPVFARARDKARQTTCLNNLRQLGTAIDLYSTDWDGRLVPCWYDHGAVSDNWKTRQAWWWFELIGRNLRSEQVLQCANSDFDVVKSYPFERTYEISYTYNAVRDPALSWRDPNSYVGPAVYLNHRPQDGGEGKFGVPLDAIDRPAELVLLAEGKQQGFWTLPEVEGPDSRIAWRHSNKANALFVDGHVKAMASFEPRAWRR